MYLGLALSCLVGIGSVTFFFFLVFVLVLLLAMMLLLINMCRMRTLNMAYYNLTSSGNIFLYMSDARVFAISEIILQDYHQCVTDSNSLDPDQT